MEANEWWIIGAGLGLLAVPALWLWRAKSWQRRYQKMSRNIERWAEGAPDQQNAGRLLKELHSWLRRCMEAGDEAGAYRLLELLKLAYGEGMHTPVEFQRLVGIVALVLEKPEMRAVGVMTLEAFTPLIRRAATTELGRAADQLGLIGVLALRYRQPFLADKAAEELLRLMERMLAAQEPNMQPLMRAMRVIGTMALRRRNMDLFQALVRDIQERAIAQSSSLFLEEWMTVLLFWLNRVARQNQLDAAELICASLEQIWRSAEPSLLLSRQWLQEAVGAAATACFNPRSTIDGLIVEALVGSVVAQRDGVLWRELAAETKRLAVFTMMRHGTPRAMRLWLPLLETARRALRAQMRDGGLPEAFRQRLISAVLQEMGGYIALIARNDMQKTPLDILKQLVHLWNEAAAGPQRRKSIQAFCQLVALRWLENKRRAKRYYESEDWLQTISLGPELLLQFGIRAAYREASFPTAKIQ